MKERIDDIFYFEIGNKLDLERKKLGYSYRYLAQLTGFSKSQLDKYFSGQQRIKKDAYKIICEALEIEPTIKIDVAIG